MISRYDSIRQCLSGVIMGLLCFVLAGCGGNQGSGDRTVSRVTQLRLDIQSQAREQRRNPGGQSRQLSPDDPGYVARLLVTVHA